MADPVTIALSAAKVAYSGCTELYSAVKGIKDAPLHIRYVFLELESLYAVLGNLTTVLHDVKASTDDEATGILLDTVRPVLDNCISLFKDIRLIVNPFLELDGNVIAGVWHGFKWDKFKKGEVQLLKDQLSNTKETLTLSLNTLIV